MGCCACTRLTAVQRQLFSCSHATVDAILWRSASVHQNDDVGNEPGFAFNAADVIMAGSKHTCHMQLAKHEAFQAFFLTFKKRRGVTDALIQGFNAFLMAESTFYLKKIIPLSKIEIEVKLRLVRSH